MGLSHVSNKNLDKNEDLKILCGEGYEEYVYSHQEMYDPKKKVRLIWNAKKKN